MRHVASVHAAKQGQAARLPSRFTKNPLTLWLLADANATLLTSLSEFTLKALFSGDSAINTTRYERREGFVVKLRCRRELNAAAKCDMISGGAHDLSSVSC